MWNDTRPILLQDALKPLSDSQALARGAALIPSWMALEESLAAAGGGGETRAVLKLLNDFYGRPGTPETRRVAQRNDVRANFAERLAMVDNRVSR